MKASARSAPRAARSAPRARPARRVATTTRKPVARKVPAKNTTRAFSQAEEPKKSNVFFSISRGGQPLGTVEFELFDKYVPKTAENFRQLAVGSKKVNGVPLHYKGCGFHRVIPKFMIQGGDFTHHNGTGGYSIYGRTFPDEPAGLRLRHSQPGLLSMANSGPGTNGSQFFVTTVPCPWLDGKHVVFGQVVKGYDVVKAIEESPTRAQDAPYPPIVIEECGVVV